MLTQRSRWRVNAGLDDGIPLGFWKARPSRISAIACSGWRRRSNSKANPAIVLSSAQNYANKCICLCEWLANFVKNFLFFEN
jgi:hypothetical protein